MKNKAQGISINTLIIAAIALLVLIILAFLLFGGGQDLSEGTQCVSKGGTCQTSCPIGVNQITEPGKQLCPSGQQCCPPFDYG